MALHVGLSSPLRLGGIFVFSGFKFPPSVTKEPEKQLNSPILISHGTSDPLLPWARSEISYQPLKENKYPITWDIQQGLQHGFSEQSWKIFRSFFEECVKATQELQHK